MGGIIIIILCLLKGIGIENFGTNLEPD